MNPKCKKCGSRECMAVAWTEANRADVAAGKRWSKEKEAIVTKYQDECGTRQAGRKPS